MLMIELCLIPRLLQFCLLLCLRICFRFLGVQWLSTLHPISHATRDMHMQGPTNSIQPLPPAQRLLLPNAWVFNFI